MQILLGSQNNQGKFCSNQEDVPIAPIQYAEPEEEKMSSERRRESSEKARSACNGRQSLRYIVRSHHDGSNHFILLAI
jgi:hypothetical protein